MRTLVVMIVLSWYGIAGAEALPLDERWPESAEAPQAELGKQVAARVIDLGNNFFSKHVDTLSHDLLTVRIDGQRQRAKIHVGGGSKYAGLCVSNRVEVVDGAARISSRVAVAIAGKRVSVQLPKFDVAGTSYRGERGVEVRLPLLRKQF